jgi:hypothetical protein
LRIKFENQDAETMARKSKSALAPSREPVVVSYSRNLNLYRITVRDQEGKISDHETKAASLALSVEDLEEQCEIIKIERIHPSTGEVLGGFYNE